ncbi:4Fe-4S dicluster domain-containing protein [Tepidibacter mesophilus]|uniref:4Fe-4S dicluster domain-containing protein n=1 Tax=Tepidibacter mesophilus TaxID=655607 RepID=UPI000C07CA61|nr:4Fe-4S dicluster domain-containing protein [Tepidibacter mesophilus]
MSQNGFYYDMTSCVQCKACQIACKDKNNLDAGICYREVNEFEIGKLPNICVYFISMSCNHCKDPICVKNCPTGAMKKRRKDGIVSVDREKCIGCRTCERKCLYGAPKYLGDKIRKMSKCDGCIDLINQGEKPVCVTACMTRSLDFGNLEEMKKRGMYNVDILGLPNPKKTKPSIVVKPKKRALKK